MTEWSIVRAVHPSLSRIQKERGTQGKIYTLWQDEHACWVSQSVPAMVSALNRVLPKIRQLQPSGLYSVMRHEHIGGYHIFFRIRMWRREDTVSLNEFLAQYRESIFVTKTPSSWKLVKSIEHRDTPSPVESLH